MSTFSAGAAAAPETGFCVIEPFLLNSKSAELYLHYILGLQFAEGPHRVPQESLRFVPNLGVCVHESAQTSLTYQYAQSSATIGAGVWLPRIIHRSNSSSSTRPDSTNPPVNRAGARALPAKVDVEVLGAAVTQDLGFESPCPDIDAVCDAIVRVCHNDESLRTRAVCIAQYLVHTRRLNAADLARQFERDPQHSRACIQKLVKHESDALSMEPRAFGPDLVTFLSAGRIQKSLNVKHIETTPSASSSSHESNTNSAAPSRIQRIVPNIKLVLLHNHPTHVWVRFRLPRPIADVTRAHNVVHISDNVYELYMRKKGKQCHRALATIVNLEAELDADIVFCSELALFAYDPLLFLSNYTKFMYCYARESAIFDPRTHAEMRHVTMMLEFGQLFLGSNNLTTMPHETHNPLIAYTGERPKLALSKCPTDTVFNVEGSRAMQSADMMSDFGAKSNFAEVIIEVALRGADKFGVIL